MTKSIIGDEALDINKLTDEYLFNFAWKKLNDEKPGSVLQEVDSCIFCYVMRDSPLYIPTIILFLFKILVSRAHLVDIGGFLLFLHDLNNGLFLFVALYLLFTCSVASSRYIITTDGVFINDLRSEPFVAVKNISNFGEYRSWFGCYQYLLTEGASDDADSLLYIGYLRNKNRLIIPFLCAIRRKYLGQ